MRSVAMLTSMSLQPVLFPIDQPVMPEERQIGRLPAIDKLEATLSTVTHQWLIGERRIGKTSVAKAVLARLRKRGLVALDIDLSKLEIAAPEHLANEIAQQGQTAQADGDEEEPELSKALAALSRRARATERHVYVLLDEVHLLADLHGAEEQVSRWCREHDSPIVFIFAGSAESAARELREPGRPLAAVGREFQLADIAGEDWLVGLRSRFSEAEVEIADRELEAIVLASGGHPRRTMLVASNVHSSACQQPDRAATETLVELAIRGAKGDRSWR